MARSDAFLPSFLSDLDSFVQVSVMPEETLTVEQLYSRAMVDTAKRYVGKREEPGNRGDFVQGVLGFFGWHKPSPWCTAFACYVAHKAADAIGMDTTCSKTWEHCLSGARLWRWARQNAPEGWCEMVYDGRDLRPGDIVIMGRTYDAAQVIRQGRLERGHTLIATGYASGTDDRFPSTEGNTDLVGDREGDGVYERDDRRFQHPLVVGAVRFQVRPREGA